MKDIEDDVEINYEYYKIDIIGWSQHKDKLDTKKTGLVPHEKDYVQGADNFICSVIKQSDIKG